MTGINNRRIMQQLARKKNKEFRDLRIELKIKDDFIIELLGNMKCDYEQAPTSVGVANFHSDNCRLCELKSRPLVKILLEKDE